MDAQLEEMLKDLEPQEFARFLKAYRAKYGKNNNLEEAWDAMLDDALGLTPLEEEDDD